MRRQDNGAAGGSSQKKQKRRSESMINHEDHPAVRNKLEDDTFSPKRRSQRVECSWTNFHCALFLGVGGFLLFWIFLLLRMYLPMENAIMTWWMGSGDDAKAGDGGEGGGGSGDGGPDQQ